MRVRMFLWVIEDPQMLVQISDDKGSLVCERTVSANANNKSITPKFFYMDVGVRQGERYESNIHYSRSNLLDELGHIPMCRTDHSRWYKSLLHGAEFAKEFLIDKRTRSAADGCNLAAFDRRDCVNDLISYLQQMTCKADECGARFGRANVPCLRPAEEAHAGIVLKLPRLHGEVGLRGVKFFSGSSKSTFLENSQEIAKVTKLCPVIHASLLQNGTVR